MAERSLDIIRTALDAFSRGGWDEALEYAAPDIVFDNSTVTGEWRGVHRGRDEARRMWATFANKRDVVTRDG